MAGKYSVILGFWILPLPVPSLSHSPFASPFPIPAPLCPFPVPALFALPSLPSTSRPLLSLPFSLSSLVASSFDPSGQSFCHILLLVFLYSSTRFLLHLIFLPPPLLLPSSFHPPSPFVSSIPPPALVLPHLLIASSSSFLSVLSSIRPLSLPASLIITSLPFPQPGTGTYRTGHRIYSMLPNIILDRHLHWTRRFAVRWLA